MGAFKIGDKVKIVDAPDLGHHIGDVGEVTKTDGRYYPYTVSVDGATGVYDYGELELVKNPAQTLKPGDIIKSENTGVPTFSVVIMVSDSIITHTEFREDIWDSLSDTTRVYATGYKVFMKSIESVNTLFEKGTWEIVDASKKEPTVKEVTLQEIADKFEVKVEEIRVKE